MARILILDGNSLVNRAFYALPPLTSAEGLPTNALHGFMTMLFKLEKEQNPDYWVVVFDKSKPTVRTEQFEGYKAQRKETPDTLRPQFSYLKEILKVMSVPMLELEGYEADDIIAAVTDRAVERGMEVSIYTGDRDALQLISPLTKVFLTMRGITEVQCYDEEKLAEEYRLKPEQIIDLKGLMGDASDNIPGIPGVGKKTALKLLYQYGTVENVLSHKNEVSGNKLQNLLKEYAEQALLSKRLAAMIHDVPINFSLEQLLHVEPQREESVQILHHYSLHTAARLFEQNADRRHEHKDQPNANGCPNSKLTHIPIPEPNMLDGQAWLEQMRSWQEQKVTLAISYRYEGTHVHQGRWSEMGICDGNDTYFLDRREQAAPVIDLWHEILADDGVRKILADVKSLYSLLFNEKKDLNGLDLDVSLAAYLLNPNQSRYSLSELLRDHTTNLFDLLAAQEAYLLRKMAEETVEKIAGKNLEKLLHEVEEPVSRVLAAMEKTGIAVDEKMLLQYGQELEAKIQHLEKDIYLSAGSPFNINSPQQLGKVLFEDLGLPPMKKTKTGYSTDAETLEELCSEHPVVEKVLEFRQLVKLNSTYVKGLLNQLHDGIIHTTFQQTVTATGRLSSIEPNLQNIPIRLDEGRKLRKVFTPTKEGWILFSADYSQIELRILAHYSRDPILCESFLAGEDVHARTASEVFQVAISDVTPDMRRKAKAVNFGLMYGLTDFGLARDLGISRKEARYYITQYFERYSGVHRYLQEVVDMAKKTGEVRTLLHRVRKIPELSHPNRMTKQFGERIAKNSPIQGTAADIMKIAMIQVYEILKELEAEVLLQVHDELLIQTSSRYLDVVSRKVKEAMETAWPISVPLQVDCKVGKNWYDLVPYQFQE
ncbi:MAG: DNA polymerase I [Candidatus Dichloromethanomonas elyunquensis]|nr:MAG: DNA polymerase I [Candidatus Dichloromethanomonas elyunquensis]